MKRKLLHIGSIAAIAGGLTVGMTPAVSSFAKADPYAQPETISIAFPGNGGAGMTYNANDKMLEYLQKKFNVTFKFVTETWSNYDQQATLWAASGQLPDIFFSDAYYTPVTFNQWIKQGVIQPIPSELSQYPYLKKIYDRPDVKAYLINGKLYYWPLSLSKTSVLPGDRGIFVRKDWMQKLHLSEPKTWNDFVNILKAFVNKNPDHKTNVVGLTANNEGFVQDLFNNELPYHGWWNKENGRWIPGWTGSNMPNMLDQVHSLYASGLLDKDFSNGNNPYDTKFVNGQAGAIVYQPKNIMNLEKVWNQAHPNQSFSQYVEPLEMPPGPGGKRYAFQYFDWWGADFINSSVDSTKLQRILAIFNYLVSPAGRELSNFGFKGTDWKMVHGAIKSLHPTSWTPSTSYDSAALWEEVGMWGETNSKYVEFKTVNPVPSGWDPATWNMIQKYYDWCLANEKPAPINWTVNAYTTTLPPITANTGDWFAQAVASKTPGAVWRKAVNTWMNGGGAQQIEQVTAKFRNESN